MPLRKKIFLYILTTVLFLLFVMSVTSNNLTERAFLDVERRFFEQDMARVQNRLDQELRIVGRYAFDWGAWDSMYYFMEEKDLPRFQEMLDPMSLRALGLDILAVVDMDFSPVIAYTVTETGEERKLTPELMSGLKDLAPKLMEGFSEGLLSDILSIGGELYLAGISPIILTNHMGSPRGFLLTGTVLAAKIPEIAASLGTSFSVTLPENPDPLLETGAVEISSSPEGMAVVLQGRKRAFSQGIPLEVRLTAPRSIYDEGRRAIHYSYLWIFLSGGGILVVVMVLIESLVLRRLDGLRSVSDRIVSEGDTGLRVPVSGSDEIANLSSSFNTLLDTLESLVSDIPDALFICSPDGTILSANREAHRSVGSGSSKTLAGKNVSSFVKKTETLKDIEEDPATGSIFSGGNVFEAELAGGQETALPVEIRRQEIHYGRLPVVLFLARDLTERKGFENRLAKMAYFDDLTGLPNRSAFIRDVNRAIKDGSRTGQIFCAALMDLDRFKLVNEQVGNINADRILSTISRRLEEVLGENFRLYRTGGDEFSLLIACPPGGNPREGTDRLMDRIHRAVGIPCSVGSETIFPSASIGVLNDIGRFQSSSEVINRLVHALREAKKIGLGFTSYHLEEENELSGPGTVNILRLSAEMHAGLEKGEFVPYFQPIYSASDGSLSGFETLARWMHPVQGLLPPSDFIPLAENTGFAGKIDMYMMKQALIASEKLRSRNSQASYVFSSNGSPLFFQTPHIVEVLEDLLRETKADPNLFTLEVTESLLAENLCEVSRKLTSLKELGVRIALDDFGTGYSSLQYINQLPLDYIKLDQSFVARLFDSGKDERLLRTIINMGKELRLEIVAEGVETKEQLEWLRTAGCDKIQGFLFSRPVPWEDIEKMTGGDHRP